MLYRRSAGVWTYVELSDETIYLRTSDCSAWVWNGTAMVRLGGGSAQIELETEISVETKDSLNPPTTKAVYDAIDSVQGDLDVNTQDIEELSGRVEDLESGTSPTPSQGRVAVEEDRDEKLYPEYWLPEGVTPVYAEDYWNWNNVKYNNDLAEAPASLAGYVDAEVRWPTEYVNTRKNTITAANITVSAHNAFIDSLRETSTAPYKLLTEDVYYVAALGQFVLKVGDVYYKAWNNSSLWNNEVVEVSDNVHTFVSATLREDTVYAANTHGTDQKGSFSGYPLYYNKVWIVRDGEREDFYDEDTMAARFVTDFRSAIHDCIVGNGGRMRLHRGRIYAVSGGDEVQSLSGFDIDGQGATLCVIPKRTLHGQTGLKDSTAYPPGDCLSPPASILGFRYCSDFTVRNVHIMGVRCGARNTASNFPFTFSYANAYGVDCIDCENIRLEDIEVGGLSKDLQIKVSSHEYIKNVVINNFCSWSSNGWYLGSIHNLVATNCILVQHEYAAAHLLYCSPCRSAKNHVYRNCRFVQDSVYNTNWMQYKQAATDVKYENGVPCVLNIRFIDCYIQYGKGTENYTPQNLLVLTLDHCDVVQHSCRHNGELGYWDGSHIAQIQKTSGAIFGTSWCSLVLKSCSFKTWGHAVYLTNNNTVMEENLTISHVTLDIEDCIFDVFDADNYSHYAQYPDYHTMYLASSNNPPRSIPRLNTLSNNRSVFGLSRDNASQTPRASGSEVSSVVSTGFSYWNTTLKKSLGLTAESDGQGHRLWADSEGSLYRDDNSPYSQGGSDGLNQRVNTIEGMLNGVVTDLAGTLALRPKGATVGVTYRDTESGKVYTCVHSGAQTKIAFKVNRVDVNGQYVPVVGNLKIYFGLTPSTYNSASAEQREKHMVLDIDLNQQTASASNTALRSWLVSQINAKYSGFENCYGNSEGKAYEISTDNVFGISSDHGFDMEENVLAAMEATGSGYAYWLFDGTGMSITKYVTNSGNTTTANVKQGRDIHADVKGTLPGLTVDQYDTAYQRLWSENSSMSTAANPVSYARYHTYGFDATWEEIPVSSGLVGKVNALDRSVASHERKKGSIPEIALWNDDSQQKSDWQDGDYWFSPTEGELKRNLEGQDDFENVEEPMLIAKSDGTLYFWTGDVLHQVTIGNGI